MFVYSMCNSVLLYVSNCFALSWPGHNCKWELVLNLPTWLNKGEGGDNFIFRTVFIHKRQLHGNSASPKNSYARSFSSYGKCIYCTPGIQALVNETTVITNFLPLMSSNLSIWNVMAQCLLITYSILTDMQSKSIQKEIHHFIGIHPHLVNILLTVDIRNDQS